MNWTYGCIFAGIAVGTGVCMSYGLNAFLFQAPVLSSCGVSWPVSSFTEESWGMIAFPSGVRTKLLLLDSETVTRVLLFSSIRVLSSALPVSSALSTSVFLERLDLPSFVTLIFPFSISIQPFFLAQASAIVRSGTFFLRYSSEHSFSHAFRRSFSGGPSLEYFLPSGVGEIFMSFVSL